MRAQTAMDLRDFLARRVGSGDGLVAEWRAVDGGFHGAAQAGLVVHQP
jgi:hypothetical protein